jgi:predicted nuclease of predicted toxin-antitoxin system
MNFPAQPTLDVGLRSAEEGQIWDHARTQGLMIVSKDTDFRERSYVEGFPPKTIWLDAANAGTAAIAELLRRERERIDLFERQERNLPPRPLNRADGHLRPGLPKQVASAHALDDAENIRGAVLRTQSRNRIHGSRSSLWKRASAEMKCSWPATT